MSLRDSKNAKHLNKTKVSMLCLFRDVRFARLVR